MVVRQFIGENPIIPQSPVPAPNRSALSTGCFRTRMQKGRVRDPPSNGVARVRGGAGISGGNAHLRHQMVLTLAAPRRNATGVRERSTERIRPGIKKRSRGRGRGHEIPPHQSLPYEEGTMGPVQSTIVGQYNSTMSNKPTVEDCNVGRYNSCAVQ
jgi:hypothetical protein